MMLPQQARTWRGKKLPETPSVECDELILLDAAHKEAAGTFMFFRLIEKQNGTEYWLTSKSNDQKTQRQRSRLTMFYIFLIVNKSIKDQKELWTDCVCVSQPDTSPSSAP